MPGGRPALCTSDSMRAILVQQARRTANRMSLGAYKRSMGEKFYYPI